MSIPKLLESQKKICLQFLQDDGPRTSFQNSKTFKKALQQEFRIQQQLRNLQDPLQFTKNQKIQKLSSEVQKAAQKLRQQVSNSVELSKTFYRNIVLRAQQTNVEKGKGKQNIFTMDHPSSNPVLINRELIKKKKEQQNHIKSPLQIFKDEYDAVLHKRSISTKPNQYYRHNPNHKGQEQNDILDIQENQTILSSQDKIGYPRLTHSQNSELLKFWRPTKSQIQIALTQNFRLDKNYKVQKLIERLQLNLVQGNYSYGQGSKQLYYDFQCNLNFQKSEENMAKQYFRKNKGSHEKQVQNILEHFLNFKMNQIKCNDLCNIGMRKVTPYRIRDFRAYKQKQQSNIIIDEIDIEKKYMQLTEQYNLAQKRQRNFKNARGLNNKVVSVDCQTIKELQGNLNFMEIQAIEDQCLDLCKKIEKFNKLRESVLKDKGKQNKLVFMKNICLQIKELLFQLLFILIKGQKFNIKQGDKIIYPMLNYREFLQAENKDQLEKKILQIALANEESFEKVKIEGITKKTVLEMYRQERANNERILEIIDSKIRW